MAVATQKRAEEVSQELVERGERAVFYHGGLGGGERDQVQDAFMADDEEAEVHGGGLPFAGEA